MQEKEWGNRQIYKMAPEKGFSRTREGREGRALRAEARIESAFHDVQGW